MYISCLQAKELDAMDEVFGIGELINEDIRENKRSAYTAKDLKGLKVEHSMVRPKFFSRFQNLKGYCRKIC